MLIIQDSMRNNITYDGKTYKFGITVQEQYFIVKKPNQIMSVYSEYIASSFINQLGIQCQLVKLGRYNDCVVNVIKDFVKNTGYILHSYEDTRQSSEDTDIGVKDYTYSDVLYMIDKHTKITEKNKEKMKEQFWDMFICDAILV